MGMRETEVGCFIRFYDRQFRTLNLQNVDGTGFSVVFSPAFPFTTPSGSPQYSGYQMPGNQIARITPPEITIHTVRRTVPNNRYQTNFIDDVYGEEGTDEEGALVGKVYSAEVDITLQLSIWAEDPRQREFIKMNVEKPFINRRKMRQLLFAIGKQNGWDEGFVVQNIFMTHRGDFDFNPQSSAEDAQGSITDGEIVPRMYTGLYDITFTTEIRDVDWFYSDSIFDINSLEEAGLDPSDYDIDTEDGLIALLIDLMKYYGIIIDPYKENGEKKTYAEVAVESSVAYGNQYNVFVDVFNMSESLRKISIGPVQLAQLDLVNDDTVVSEVEEERE